MNRTLAMAGGALPPSARAASGVKDADNDTNDEEEDHDEEVSEDGDGGDATGRARQQINQGVRM